jgi:hypothetical protein
LCCLLYSFVSVPFCFFSGSAGSAQRHDVVAAKGCAVLALSQAVQNEHLRTCDQLTNMAKRNGQVHYTFGHMHAIPARRLRRGRGLGVVALRRNCQHLMGEMPRVAGNDVIAVGYTGGFCGCILLSYLFVITAHVSCCPAETNTVCILLARHKRKAPHIVRR